ncbi:MAG TPA: hypothetical protein VHC69_06845 [Polyangiaceae bacterium]|nr:hypothetical protein [Polyangiaceae bacterium]
MSRLASSEARAEARRLRDAGLSLREIAERVGFSHVSVAKWLAVPEAVDVPPAVVAPAPLLSPLDVTPDGAEPLDLASTLEFVKESMRNSRNIADEARKVGNFSAAQRATRDVAAFSAIVARLEKQAVADEGSVRYSREDIDRAIAGVRERVASLVARGLRCQDCGRKLAASWGGVDAAKLATIGVDDTGEEKRS